MSVAQPPRLLKADAVRDLGAKVVFNFEDVQQRCDAYVEQARRQTQQMIADAASESEAMQRQTLESARDEGFRQGLEQADEKIHRQAEQIAEQIVGSQLASTSSALQLAVEDLNRQRDRWLAHWQTAAIELSVAIAEKLIHRQLSLQPEICLETVRSALELAAGTSTVRLRLHPEDLELLGSEPEAYLRELSSCAEVALIPDDEITRGGCRVDTAHGVIDARLETQLRRIADELTGSCRAEEAD